MIRAVILFLDLDFGHWRIRQVAGFGQQIEFDSVTGFPLGPTVFDVHLPEPSLNGRFDGS
jgi:hypothetical protein